MLTIEH